MLLLATILAGCGNRDQAAPTDSVDLVELLHILPTPAGLDQSNDTRAADLATVRSTFAAGLDVPAEAADQYEKLGLRESAIRTWSGPGGARVVILATRWPNRMTAANTGAGAADVLPIREGARPWTPSKLRSARGSRLDEPGRRRSSLSLAVQSVNLFIRAEGPVDEDAVIRTLEFASKPLVARSEQ